MNKIFAACAGIALVCLFCANPQGPLENNAQTSGEGIGRLANYNVVWDSPSTDYNGSMPLGNGDIALNAWVEESGDLIFFIAKTDSWDDNGRLVKVGRVRISLSPKPKAPLAAFRQTLQLLDATMSVRYGEGDSAVDLRLWVDANLPVIQVEVESRQPTEAVASTELWRTSPYPLPTIEVSDVMLDRSNKGGQHAPTIVEPDTILEKLPNRIGWCHYNSKSVGPEICAKIQGVEGFQRPDPLLHRTFGAVVTADRPERIDDKNLKSSSSNRHVFNICVLTRHPAKPEEWLGDVNEMIKDIGQQPLKARRRAHEQWWRGFWDRSWIHVAPATGSGSAAGKEAGPSADDTYIVSRAYALQRFINACAGRGRYPIKFNGSLFTVPYQARPGAADYRQWGPGYWWQNTRLPYISMCASCDFDLMQPLFRMYGQDLMPFFRYRTRLYLNHDGIYIPECIYFWGDVFSETYGWEPFEKRDDKLQASGWHKWEWVSGPELVFMMLDRYEYSLEEAFLREVALPAAHEVLTFFDQHYPTDASGTMVMHPAQAVETWWDCTNPMPELAGLYAVTERLLALPERLTSAEQRTFWTRLRKKLPPLPTREVDGKTLLAPAAKYADKKNVENPELYAVFPFRLIAIGRPNIEWGREALERRLDRGDFGWRQDDIFMAYLGLADAAKQNLVSRAKNVNKESRFPAFWGPNYDWIPDQDHGGILLKTLQAMLLQTDGRKIYLCPAWPKDWNADFKLHAPYQTVIRATIEKGKVTRLDVQPESRRKDVVLFPEK
jgi:alpha-L-fucosidase 2